MNYDLTIFDKLVYGSLSPFYEEWNDTTKHIEFLNKFYSKSTVTTIGNFKQINGRFKLLYKKEICSLHPSAKKYITNQQSLFSNNDTTGIDPIIFDQLQIERSKIQKIIHFKQINKTTIGLSQKCDWQTMSKENLKYYFYCGILEREKENLIDTIKANIHRLNSKGKIEQYVHKHQQALIDLCLNISKQTDFKDNYTSCRIRENYSEVDILAVIYHYLEKVLRFKESRYLHYIDKTVLIPYQSKLVEEYEFESKLDVVQSVFLEIELSTQLRLIILLPLFKLTNLNSKNRITYHELIYFNSYLSYFHEEIKTDPNLNEKRIVNILFQLNFNSKEFVEYLTTIFEKAIENQENEINRIEYLNTILKQTNQRTSCEPLANKQFSPSIKTQISSWIEEEIHCIQSNLIFFNTDKNLFSKVKTSDSTKIETSQTVAELALFYRLLVDAGIISHKNQTEIFQHLAASYRTKKMDEISAVSIRTKYYRPESHTIAAIKQQLKQMIKILETY